MSQTSIESALCLREILAGGTAVVELRGEIDILTAPAISARLDDLTRDPRPDLVVDLRPVTFIDCSGLGALCRARNRARARGGRLRLVVSSSRILWLLRHTDLGRAFDVRPDLPDGLVTAPAGGDGAPAGTR